jgi:hypothetical protein
MRDKASLMRAKSSYISDRLDCSVLLPLCSSSLPPALSPADLPPPAASPAIGMPLSDYSCSSIFLGVPSPTDEDEISDELLLYFRDLNL